MVDYQLSVDNGKHGDLKDSRLICILITDRINVFDINNYTDILKNDGFMFQIKSFNAVTCSSLLELFNAHSAPARIDLSLSHTPP